MSRGLSEASTPAGYRTASPESWSSRSVTTVPAGLPPSSTSAEDQATTTNPRRTPPELWGDVGQLSRGRETAVLPGESARYARTSS